jgi:CBS domain-containing protein
MPCSEVRARFEQDPALHALPVVDAGRPVGLIQRRAFMRRFGRPLRGQRLERRACGEVMDRAPLIVEKDTGIPVLARHLARGEQRHLAEGFVVTERGRYAGLGTGQQVIRALTLLLAEQGASGPEALI